MDAFDLYLPAPGGAAELLADEVARLLDVPRASLQVQRSGVALHGGWEAMLRLNLHSRIAQRVLLRLHEGPYQDEDDVYAAAAAVPWEEWFGPRQTFKVEVTAQKSPLRSVQFAGLRVKDAVCDRLRQRRGARPSVDTAQPDVRLHLHLQAQRLALLLDTSGEPLFKRGWREDKGEAPLKETLAAAVLAATGWDAEAEEPLPLVDPFCGSGTLVIEAAQRLLRLAPGRLRRFAFERLLPHDAARWAAVRDEARAAERTWPAGRAPRVYGSDVAFRMVDFARRNAARAGVLPAVELRGGDALQRRPPVAGPGLLVLNPPYGERIGAAGVAGALGADEFWQQLAAHWKRHWGGWTAWILSPDPGLPGRLRLKASRRVPLYNGPIECRLLRFDLQAKTGIPDTSESG